MKRRPFYPHWFLFFIFCFLNHNDVKLVHFLVEGFWRLHPKHFTFHDRIFSAELYKPLHPLLLLPAPLGALWFPHWLYPLSLLRLYTWWHPSSFVPELSTIPISLAISRRDHSTEASLYGFLLIELDLCCWLSTRIVPRSESEMEYQTAAGCLANAFLAFSKSLGTIEIFKN